MSTFGQQSALMIPVYEKIKPRLVYDNTYSLNQPFGQNDLRMLVPSELKKQNIGNHILDKPSKYFENLS
jgi:hypothetical protein